MRTHQSKLLAAALVAVCGGWSTAQAQTPSPQQWKEGVLTAPSSLVTEHSLLREDLLRAAADPGGVGDAAKAVEHILTPHLQHQEQVVLLPLGMIRGLVDGEPMAEPARVLEIVDQIDRELPQLLQEHRAILDATRRFSDAARREGKAQYLRLADRIRTHILLEDQVLYPSALLVGRYLKSSQDPKRPRTASRHP